MASRNMTAARKIDRLDINAEAVMNDCLQLLGEVRKFAGVATPEPVVVPKLKVLQGGKS